MKQDEKEKYDENEKNDENKEKSENDKSNKTVKSESESDFVTIDLGEGQQAILAEQRFPFLSVAMIIIGSIYINDCPAKPMIPIYLVVAGVSGVLHYLFGVGIRYISVKGETVPQSECKEICLLLRNIFRTFIAIWFICGAVWVYESFQPMYMKPYEPEEIAMYCDVFVYLFAFWFFNFAIGVIIVTMVVIGCFVGVTMALVIEDQINRNVTTGYRNSTTRNQNTTTSHQTTQTE